MPLLIYLTDIKLSQAQISNITQSGRSFGSWLANLGKKALTNVAILLILFYSFNQFNLKCNKQI